MVRISVSLCETSFISLLFHSSHKALDFWLSHIQSHPGLVSRHYSANSFFALSSSATKSLFLDMITSLQPLAQMPFRLEYNFEFRILKERHQKQMADYMLEKHVSHSADALIEGHQALHQRALGLENISTTTSLHADLKGEVSKHAMAIGKQTRDYLQARGKRIFQKIQHGELLPKEGRTSGVSQVPKLRGINDSATTPCSSTCTVSSDGSDAPPTMFQNSESDDSRSGEGNAWSDPADESNALQIVKNNEMMVDLANSDITSPESIFSKVARQFKEMASPSQEKDVYKRGVTEYEFDSDLPMNADTASKISAELETHCPGEQVQGSDDAAVVNRRPQSLFDDHGMPSRPLSHAPEFQIPRRGSIKQDKAKYLSDCSSSSSATPSALKRWSSLGPKLIKAFDKLLLDSTGIMEKTHGYRGKKVQAGGSGVSRSVSMDSSKLPVPSKTTSQSVVRDSGVKPAGSMNTAGGNRSALQRGKSLDERALRDEKGAPKVKDSQTPLIPSPPTTPIGYVPTSIQSISPQLYMYKPIDIQIKHISISFMYTILRFF